MNDKTLADWNFGLIRGPLVLFVIAALVASGLAYAASTFWSDVDRQYQRDRRALRAAQTRYRTVDDEKEVIANYLPRFEMLREAGIVGEERRLQWVETLREVARELRLPALRYNLGARESMTPFFSQPPGGYEVHESVMQLDIGLVHEGDLLRLFEELDRRVEGLFDVTGCSVELDAPYKVMTLEDAEAMPMEEAGGPLSARCTVRWLTLTAPEPTRLAGN